MAANVYENDLQASVAESLPSLQNKSPDELLTEAAEATQTAHQGGQVPQADMISWQDIGDLKNKLIAKAQPIVCPNAKIIDTTLDVANTASVAALLLSGGISLPEKVVITLAAAIIRMGVNTVCANYKPAAS